MNKWCVWQAPRGRLRINELVSISNVCLKIASIIYSRDHRCKRESPNDRFDRSTLWWILFENSRRLFPLIVNEYNNWSMNYVINICTLKCAVDVSRGMRALAYTVMNEWRHQCRDSTIAMIQATSIEKQKHSTDVRKFKRRIAARWKDSRVIVYQYGSLKAACTKKVYNARTIAVASIIFTNQYSCLFVLKIIYLFSLEFFWIAIAISL